LAAFCGSHSNGTRVDVLGGRTGGIAGRGKGGALSVVEDEPVGELAVEEGEVGKEQVFLLIDERFLEDAIEVGDPGIHLLSW
jgi:hypothetical protein